MDKDLEAIAQGVPSAPQYRYATLVSFDPETSLSTISILDEEITDVPKLAHVSLLERGEQLLATGNAPSDTTLSISVPSGCKYGARVKIMGRLTSGTETILMRVNNDATSGLYRRVRTSLEGSTLSGAASTSATEFAPGIMSTVNGFMDVKLVPVQDRTIHNGQTQIFSTGYDTSNNTSQIASGRLQTATTINTLDFIASNNWHTDTTWKLYGTKTAYDSAVQVLCLKTKQVPLTIIGVLDGKTI